MPCSALYRLMQKAPANLEGKCIPQDKFEIYVLTEPPSASPGTAGDSWTVC